MQSGQASNKGSSSNVEKSKQHHDPKNRPTQRTSHDALRILAWPSFRGTSTHPQGRPDPI